MPGNKNSGNITREERARRAEAKANGQVYTLVFPVIGSPGKFVRKILKEHELVVWFRKNLSDTVPQRFYVEPHNGVDNEALIATWPSGLYQ